MRRWTIFLWLLLLLSAGCNRETPKTTGFLQGEFAFIPRKNTVQVISISHQTEPAFVTELTLPGEAMKVLIDGRFAYILYYTVERSGGGLQIVDLADPTQPRLHGTFYTNNLANNIAIQNEVVALAHWDGVILLNVNDKDNPEIIAELEDKANGLFFHGDQLVTTWGGCDFRSGFCTGGLRVYDISNVQQPQEISYLTQDELPSTGVVVVDNYAFVNGKGLWVAELNGEPDLAINGRYEFGVGFLYNGHVVIQDNIAYADATGGLVLLDISQPTAPTRLGFYEPLSYILDLAVRDDYAYLIGEQGLEILDIADPANPRLAGRYTFEAASTESN